MTSTATRSAYTPTIGESAAVDARRDASHVDLAAAAGCAMAAMTFVACAHSPPPPPPPPRNVAPPEIVLPKPGQGCTSLSHRDIRVGGDRAIVEHLECEERGPMPPGDDDVPLRTTLLVLYRLGVPPIATEIDKQIFGGMADPHTAFVGVLDAPQLRDDAAIVAFETTGDDPDPPYGKRTTLQIYAFVGSAWKSVYQVSGSSVLVEISENDPSRATLTPCEKNPATVEEAVETCGDHELVTGRIHIRWNGTEVEASGLEPPVDRNALP